MGGLLQPTPAAEETSSRKPILVGVAAVLVLMGLVAFLMRSKPKPPLEPPPYAAHLVFSDPLRPQGVTNFVGANITYIEGTITNTGDKTVTHAVVTVTFRDDMGQIAQRESVPLHILQETGPYPDPVDLKADPLKPGQSRTFRLTFENISAQWTRAYPELQIISVNLK